VSANAERERVCLLKLCLVTSGGQHDSSRRKDIGNSVMFGHSSQCKDQHTANKGL